MLAWLSLHVILQRYIQKTSNDKKIIYNKTIIKNIIKQQITIKQVLKPLFSKWINTYIQHIE